MVCKSIVEVRIDRDTLAKTIFIVNAYLITVSTLYIRLTQEPHCVLRYFVYISYLPPVSLNKIGKTYLNRTLVLKNLLLFLYQARASNYVKRCVADQALVREGDSRRNPVPLLANHKKFIRSALFLVNKNSG